MTGGIAAGTLTERFERFAYEAPPPAHDQPPGTARTGTRGLGHYLVMNR